MSAVRRTRDGRIVIVPDLDRVHAMRKRATPKKPTDKKPTTAPAKSTSPTPAPETPADTTTRLTGDDAAEYGRKVLEDAGVDIMAIREEYGDPADIAETGDETTPEPEPLPTPPRGNASRNAWIDYAMAANISVNIDGTRNEIRDHVNSVLARMSQPAREGGRLARPEDEPVTPKGDHAATDRV